MLSHALLTTLLSGVGTTLTVAVSLPQLSRLYRTRAVAGVSAATASFTCIAAAAWAGYGLANGLPLLAVSSGLALAVQLPVLLLLAREGAWSRSARCLAVAIAMCYVAVGVAAGWAALGALLVAHVLIQYGPQLGLVLRSADLSGLSTASAAMLFVNGAVWAAAGAAGGQAALLAWGSLVGIVGLALLARTTGRIPALPGMALPRLIG